MTFEKWLDLHWEEGVEPTSITTLDLEKTFIAGEEEGCDKERRRLAKVIVDAVNEHHLRGNDVAGMLMYALLPQVGIAVGPGDYPFIPDRCL